MNRQDGRDRTREPDQPPAIPGPPAFPAFQYVNVPKNEERLFGSLHFVPSDEPVNACCSVTPISRVRRRHERVEPLHRAARRIVGHHLVDCERDLRRRDADLLALSLNWIGAGVTATMFETMPFDSSLAIAMSAICCGAVRARVDVDRRADVRLAAADFGDAEVAIAGDRRHDRRPSSETPLNEPRSTFHASTACLPIVSASLPMMQPPVNTSAVRASTYSPLTVALPPATRGAAARPTNAATTIARFIDTLELLNCELDRL